MKYRKTDTKEKISKKTIVLSALIFIMIIELAAVIVLATDKQGGGGSFVLPESGISEFLKALIPNHDAPGDVDKGQEPRGDMVEPEVSGIGLTTGGIEPEVGEIEPPGEGILPTGDRILPPGEGILSTGEGILPVGEGIGSVDDVEVQPASDVTEPGVAGKYPDDY
jgi:hypothetical protein